MNSFVGQEKETTIPNTRNIITSCNFLSREFGRAEIIELERQSRIIGWLTYAGHLSMILSRSFCTMKSRMVLARLMIATTPQ